MKNANYLLLLIIVLILSGLPSSGFAGDADSIVQKDSALKVYVIYTRGGSESMGAGVVVSRLSSADFHGIRCLVGEGVEGYMKSLTVRIPIEGVVMIMEYESKKAWEDSVQSYFESKANTKNN